MTESLDDINTIDYESPIELNNWTFYSAESNNKYTVLDKVASLSEVFKKMIENAISNNNERIVSLPIVEQHDEYTNEIYKINTDKLLNYVYKYFLLWKDEPDKADYVQENPIQTSEIAHVLHKKDIDFINSYLNDELGLYTSRQNKLKALSVLLSQVSEFLEINSLSKKIYAYIAVMIWNLSINDFSDALNNSNELKQEYDVAIKSWVSDNSNKFVEYISKHENCSRCLAPIINSEIDFEKIINIKDINESDLSNENIIDDIGNEDNNNSGEDNDNIDYDIDDDIDNEDIEDIEDE